MLPLAWRRSSAGLRICSSTWTRSKVTIPSSDSSAATARRRRLRPKLSQDKFKVLTTSFLDRVQVAVAPLEPPMNENFSVERSEGKALPPSMIIRTNAKEFVIEVVSAKQQLHMTSPISGLRAYEWNPRTQRWEDESDSHDIEGLLTRDLMRLCSGIPSF